MSSLLLPGVDKIGLHTKDFVVSDGDTLYQNSIIPPGTSYLDLPILFVDERGRPIHKTKVWVDPKKTKVPYQLDINRNGLFISANPSKSIHPWNLNSDVDSVSEFIKSVHLDCRSLGIKFDLDSCDLKRVDLAKQDFMGRDLSMYGPAYDLMKGDRKKKILYPNGATWQNKQSEVCFYDKGIESNLKNIYGLLRAESRFKKTDQIVKFIGVRKWSEFIKTDCYFWDEAYRRHINSSVFSKYSGDLFILDFDSEVDRIRHIAEVNSRNIALNYLAVLGVERILSFPSGIDTFKDILLKADVVSTRQVNKIISDVRSLILMIPKKVNHISVIELMNELKLKFVA